MTSPGKKKPTRPNVVRRERSGDQPSAERTTKSPEAKSSAAKSSAAPKAGDTTAGKKIAGKKTAAKKTAGKKSAGKQAGPAKKAGAIKKTPPAKKSTAPKKTTAAKRKTTAAAPTPEVGFWTRTKVSGGARALHLQVGVLAFIGLIFVVLADFMPRVILDGTTVTPQQHITSIVGNALLIALAIAAAVLLIGGRGGRAGLGLIATVGAIAPAQLGFAIYEGAQPQSHALAEYYFGVLHTTISMEPQIGRTFAMLGWALVLLAGGSAVAAWFRTPQPELAPIDPARRVGGGAAALCAILAAVAFLVPSAITSIEKVTEESTGLVITRDMIEPVGVLGLGGLGFVAGLLLLAGWLASAAIVGAAATRATTTASLIGLAIALLYVGLLSARDAAVGPNLVAGPRTYLLLLAGITAAAVAIYTTRARRTFEVALRSDESDLFT